MTPSIDPRWAPFAQFYEGKICIGPGDMCIGRRRSYTWVARPNGTDRVTQMRDLFVFGEMRFDAARPGPRRTMAFDTIYLIGGKLSSRGVDLTASRVVLMTMQQFMRGFASVLLHPSVQPDEGGTIALLPEDNTTTYLTSDIDSVLPNGTTGLIWAVHCKDEALVRLFIDAGANLDVTCNQWTALGWAVLKGHANLARMLLEAGANPLPVMRAFERNNHHTPAILLAETIRAVVDQKNLAIMDTLTFSIYNMANALRAYSGKLPQANLNEVRAFRNHPIIQQIHHPRIKMALAYLDQQIARLDPSQNNRMRNHTFTHLGGRKWKQKANASCTTNIAHSIIDLPQHREYSDDSVSALHRYTSWVHGQHWG